MTGLPKNLFNKIRQMIFQYSDKLPYKVYTVLLKQSNTDDPIALELENTLGVTATFEYVNTGEYIVTFNNGLFNSPDEYVVITGVGFNQVVSAVPVFFNVLAINSYDAGFPSDDVLGSNAPCILEIRKYN